MLVETLPSLENHTAVFEKQPQESPTAYAGMIRKEMGNLDWKLPALRLERLIRGLNPWPSAYTFLGKKSLKLWQAQVLENVSGQDARREQFFRRTRGISGADRGRNSEDSRAAAGRKETDGRGSVSAGMPDPGGNGSHTEQTGVITCFLLDLDTDGIMILPMF